MWSVGDGVRCCGVEKPRTLRSDYPDHPTALHLTVLHPHVNPLFRAWAATPTYGTDGPRAEEPAHVRKSRPTCRTDGSRSSKARHLTANTPNHVPTKAHASRPSQEISQNADHLAHNSPFPTLVAEVVCTLGGSTLAPDSTRRKWAYRTCRVAGVRASYALGCPSCSLRLVGAHCARRQWAARLCNPAHVRNRQPTYRTGGSHAERVGVHVVVTRG